MKYDYYKIEIPEDFGSTQERMEQAVVEAREKTRLFIIPCEWVCVGVYEDTLVIRRKRINAEEHNKEN